MARNFHGAAFDEGTKVKLGLFQEYTKEWLPVWLSQARPQASITIADFFAGPGADSAGVPGSPLIVLQQLRQYAKYRHERAAKVRLLLNESSISKARTLAKVMHAQDVPSTLCEWEVLNHSFQHAFQIVYPTLQSGPNLLILDQQGIKEISNLVFNQILNLPRTDFLFFIASSSIRRFGTHPNFQKHLRIPRGAISNSTFNDTHRAVTRHYRALAIASGHEYYLGSFSIKKASNIYGLIFGSHHPLGLEKFLRTCWKADPARGEANFDIDGDKINVNTPRLFAEMDQPKKLCQFQHLTKQLILTGQLTTDRDVYIHTLQEGFLPAEGRNVIRELVRDGQARVIGGQPRVSRRGYDEPRGLEVSTSGPIQNRVD